MIKWNKIGTLVAACIWAMIAFADAPPARWWPPTSVHPDSDANHPRHNILRRPAPASPVVKRDIDWKKEIAAFLDWLDWRGGGTVGDEERSDQPQHVPEPGTLVLVGLGLGMIMFRRRNH
jgi:hypothetical protein